jgi:hypothetical protein
MPIGSAKIGVLGAGLVPGGTETFNTSGTFSVPPGVKKVNITGKGATGNPGNAGNSGNAGNPGSGGGGGSGGVSSRQGGASPIGGTPGGIAYKNTSGRPCSFVLPGAPYSPITPWFNSGTAPAPLSPLIAMGGAGPCSTPCFPLGRPSNGAQTGISGNAGSAGNAGNPGNAGNSSSTLCKNFPGGAGGNAGVAGAAGNGGGSGPAGGQGGNADTRNPGSAGTGAGAGGAGGVLSQSGNPACRPLFYYGGNGGGGAGISNDGAAGRATVRNDPGAPQSCTVFFSVGGNYECSTRALTPGNPAAANIMGNFKWPRPPTCVANNMIGSPGSMGPPVSGITRAAITMMTSCNVGAPSCTFANVTSRSSVSQFSPSPLAPEIFRAGAGGGGAAGYGASTVGANHCMGGGGGGGGRGGAGNAGGTSSAPSGSAATPTTFNCVSVTPGGSVPVTVASPGGQIVISWNPQ